VRFDAETGRSIVVDPAEAVPLEPAEVG
jgi:hypothetical protein